MFFNQKNKAFSLIELGIVIVIIGILILAVSQGGGLATKSKITFAKSLTNSSPLVNHADVLELWLETSSDKSFVDNISDGDFVKKWNSLAVFASKKNIKASDDDGVEPIYRNNVHNGLPAVEFSGTKGLSFAEIGALQGLSSYTIIMVAEGSDDVIKSIFKCFTEDGIEKNSFLFNASVLPAIVTYSVSFNDGQSWYKNGETERPLKGGDMSFFDPIDETIERCTIGPPHYKGNIFEFIIISKKLNNDDLDEIHQYLANKYKIDGVINVQ